ncbi:MAG: NAD(P)/FAD-dependent oxidoreductase [Candidatus Altiarchaeota archaeon]
MVSSVVVGGGPAGSVAAKTLAQSGDVAVFEEHESQPVQCAGIISISGLESLGIDPGDSVVNKVSGARFYSPEGRVVELRPGKEMAYVVDRRRFDEILLQEAVDAGASLYRERVVGVSQGIVKSASRSIEADRIILASGVDYGFHRRLGLDYPARFLVGAQADVQGDFDPDFCEVHFNVPGFFSWIIPAGDTARIGLCAYSNPAPLLNSFIKKFRADGRLKKNKPKNRVYGIIPIYNPALKADYGFIRTVGDAAGQVKATTGGGVVLGCAAAKLVGEKDYERAWRKKIGKELSLHLKIRGSVDKLNAKNTDLFFDLLEAGAHALEGGGDMDLASKNLASVFLDPTFMGTLIYHAPRLMLSLL